MRCQLNLHQDTNHYENHCPCLKSRNHFQFSITAMTTSLPKHLQKIDVDSITHVQPLHDSTDEANEDATNDMLQNVICFFRNLHQIYSAGLKAVEHQRCSKSWIPTWINLSFPNLLLLQIINTQIKVNLIVSHQVRRLTFLITPIKMGFLCPDVNNIRSVLNLGQMLSLKIVNIGMQIRGINQNPWKMWDLDLIESQLA